MERKILWFEVWIDYSRLSYSGQYLLLLRAYDDGSFETLNPQHGYALDKKFSSYEEATFDLEEDEYQQIEGRYLVED